MKVVILCGGMGTRLRDETDVRPKPMVEIGGRPILWHIMKTYARYGYNDFVLCLGYKGEIIKEYFYNYEMLTNDFTVILGSRDLTVHRTHSESGWKITLADTGLQTKTGARVKRAGRYFNDDLFMLTYGDGLTDLDVSKLVAFHQAHGKIGTVTGVTPPSRYGELFIEGTEVRSFREKPVNRSGSINGGYFVFRREFLDYLDEDEGCVLEHEPLEKLAADGQLAVFNHPGFWQCMDTYRDLEYLRSLWTGCTPPWKVW